MTVSKDRPLSAEKHSYLPLLLQAQQDSTYQGGKAVSKVMETKIRCLSKAEVEKVLYMTKKETQPSRFLLKQS